MRLFYGRKIAKKILDELKYEIRRKKIQPNLAVILVGDDEPSKIYVRLKKEAGERVKIKVDVYKFKGNAKEGDVLAKIKELNKNKKVSGIIVQLPLPAYLNKNKITNAINPQKDVDGFHQINQKLLTKGRPRFIPPLPAAILLAIKEAYRVSIPVFFSVIPAQAGIQSEEALTPNKILDPRFPPATPAGASQWRAGRGDDKLQGKKAIALVNSDTFGGVLKMVFKKEGLKFDYLVRKVCTISGSEEELEHRRLLRPRYARIASQELAMQQDADILVAACGCPNLVGKDMIKKGAVLIDAGITRYRNKKVVGDVDRKDVSKKAGFLTPVPGGIGPVAVALLLRNVYLATKK